MKNLSIGVLISGRGSTLQCLVNRRAMDEVPADIELVISSHGAAEGLEFAKQSGIDTEIVSRHDFADGQAHSEAIFSLCRKRGIQLLVMGGYLEHLLIPDDFANRVINIHPSLIPAFCGKGFYGQRVHQAVLDFGAKITGCTVHFVDNEYDHGPIIAQRCCPVFAGDTADSLRKRVFELECQLYADVIAVISRGHISVSGRTVTVDEIV